MEGTIHILNAFEQEYWIDGALVDKVTIGKYDLRRNGKDAYVYYKKGKVETISHVIKVEVLGTYTLVPKPIPTIEEDHTENYEQLSPEMKTLLSQEVEELNLSVRTRNILKANGIDTVLDICRMKRTDCLKFRNGGKKSLTELDDFLTAHNLTWGMDL
jgi:DNA-directed RNA polymerase alpha subunit